MQHHYRSVLLFLLVGVVATGQQFLLLSIFVEVFVLNKVFASASSYILSAIGNYLLNYYFTFHSQQQHSKTLPKFMMASAIGLLINTLTFAIMLSLSSYYLIAQIIATGTTFIVNYLLHRYWIYRSDT